MKSIEIYENYKETNKEKIIIIKEGIFYKTFKEDANILWYVFDYKLSNSCLSFGSNSYQKVIEKLEKLGLGYLVYLNPEEQLVKVGDEEVYQYHCILATKSLEKQLRKEELLTRIDKLLYSDNKYYQIISNFIDKLEIE